MCRVNTDTYDMESSNTPRHTCSHTLSPLLPWPNTPSHPRSLTHTSDVSGSNTPAGRPLISLLFSQRYLGTRRGGSQPSHSPPAHAQGGGALYTLSHEAKFQQDVKTRNTHSVKTE